MPNILRSLQREKKYRGEPILSCRLIRFRLKRTERLYRWPGYRDRGVEKIENVCRLSPLEQFFEVDFSLDTLLRVHY